MNRRDLIRGIGAALCAGVTPKFVSALVDPIGISGKQSAYIQFNDGDRIALSGMQISIEQRVILIDYLEHNIYQSVGPRTATVIFEGKPLKHCSEDEIAIAFN